MPQAEIVNGHTSRMFEPLCGGDCVNFDNSRFRLNLNGASYRLRPPNPDDRHGRYIAEDNPEIKIMYMDSAPGNVTGEYWEITIADGTIYRFGYTPEAEQVVAPVSNNWEQPRNKKFSAASWQLDQVINVYDRKISYTFETTCGENSSGVMSFELDEEDTFHCTEVGIGLKEIAYNYVGTTAKTKILFTNTTRNDSPLSKTTNMTIGRYRPDKIEIVHDDDITIDGEPDDTTIAGYQFDYEDHIHSGDGNTEYEYWYLTDIIRFGADYSVDNNDNAIGTSLPVQSFEYTQDAQGCGETDDDDEGDVCVRLMTKSDNGYGAVTELTYAYIDGDDEGDNDGGYYVTQIDTWDGVKNKYNQQDATVRTVYHRNDLTVADGSAPPFDACFESTDSACKGYGAPNSDMLIGFSGVVIDTQEKQGSWVTLSRTKQTFHNDGPNDNYWLHGKNIVTQQRDPTVSGPNGIYAKDTLTWEKDPDADSGYVRVTRVDHERREGSSSVTWHEINEYDSAATSYGALLKTREYDPTGALYRCTNTAYSHQTSGAWLINRIKRETIYSGNCGSGKTAETLYRYDNSSNPNDSSLGTKGQLEWILRWDNTQSKYVSQKMTYYTPITSVQNNGLLHKTHTYSDLSSTVSYASSIRSTVSIDSYNNLGQPTGIETTGSDVADREESISYDSTFPWLPEKQTDINLLETSYVYDLFGRLYEVLEPGDTSDKPTLRYTYWDGENLFTDVEPLMIAIAHVDNDVLHEERTFYDGLGRVVQTQLAQYEVYGETKNRDIVTTYDYDARGLRTCQTTPYAVDDYSWNGNSPYEEDDCASVATNTLTTYDAVGRELTITTPDGNTSSYFYGVANNLTYADFTNANGHRIQHRHDALGRLKETYEIVSNAVYATTSYAYDVLDNLRFVYPELGGNTEMQYDSLSRKTYMNDPDMGEWNYEYDAAGNLTRQEANNENDDGQAICFYYDALNRLRRKANDSSPGNACPAYASSSSSGSNHLASYTYDTASKGMGKPATLSWGSSPTNNRDSYSYDSSQGRLQTTTRTIDGKAFTLTTNSWDALDRPTQITYPNGEAQSISYDEEGVDQLVAGGTTILSDVGYNERSQLRKLTLGNSNAADVTYSYYGASENYQLQTISWQSSEPDFNYGYDNVGNITSLSTDTGETQSFGYDQLNRLTSASATSGTNYSHIYSYDKIGNLTSRTGGGNRSYSYNYGNKPHALQSITGGITASLTYDDNGNMTQRTVDGTTYDQTFDVQNRMTSVDTGGETTQFQYDANGQRTLVIRPDGTKIYTPFPGYQVEISGILAPHVVAAIERSGNSVRLYWAHESQNSQYKVYHHPTSPYFNPGDAGSTLLATLNAPTAQYIHSNALADTNNGFYVVVAVNGQGSYVSHRLGEFNFILEPGTALVAAAQSQSIP
ncbi:MAG: RHS repeat protein, partial [Chloroflexi bacterium]|nr:RHS repeat protein [Chloroflexota bacterium]